LRGRLLGRLGFLFFGGLLLGLGGLPVGFAGLADDRELAAHLDRVVLLGDDLLQHTGRGRRDLGVDLVGGNLQ
jgi:hypothetical protein